MEGGRSADRGYRINDTHIHSYSLSAANSRVACLIYNGTLYLNNNMENIVVVLA